jgi:hypothetical protein
VPKWLAFIKTRNFGSKQQGYLPARNHAQTNINQTEKYFKKAIELGLSMDMVGCSQIKSC